MKPRTLLILLALVVGLGAFVWFYEREQPGSEEREKLANRVLGVEREDIARLEVHAGDRTVELVRTHEAEPAEDEAAGSADDAGAAPSPGTDDQDRWRLRRPIDFPADYWQADALARTLTELERTRELDDYDAREVGLDPPRGRVVVELEDGTKKELRIGAAVPGSESLIVAVDGEPGASVVAATLWESVAKDAAEWRDKDLFARERDDIASMTIERSASMESTAAADGGTPAASAEVATAPSRVKLTRAGDDFELALPLRDRADADAVNALVRELTGLRASEFLDAPPPLAELGLDPPRATLTVELDDVDGGAPFVVLWGNRKEGGQESYAKVGDLVVTTAAALDESLDRAAMEWRSKDWSSMPVFEVDRVTVSGASGALDLTRNEGSWKRGEEAIDYGPVSDFLYAIDDARAERIASTADALALVAAELTIELAALDDGTAASPPTQQAETGDAAADMTPAKRERLELFAATPENLVPVRTSGRDAVLLIKRETRDEIVAKLETVRDAKVATEEPVEEAEETPNPE